jgi:hypothetical protein
MTACVSVRASGRSMPWQHRMHGHDSTFQHGLQALTHELQPTNNFLSTLIALGTWTTVTCGGMILDKAFGSASFNRSKSSHVAETSLSLSSTSYKCICTGQNVCVGYLLLCVKQHIFVCMSRTTFVARRNCQGAKRHAVVWHHKTWYVLICGAHSSTLESDAFHTEKPLS